MKKKILSVILASVMCLTSLVTTEAMTGSSVISITAEAASYKTGTYKVTHSNGVNVRKKASTSAAVVGASAKGTTFTVKEIKTAGGYTWGRTDSIKCTNGKKSGWVALKYCTYQAPKSAEISFKDVSFPSSVTKGKGQHLAGTISSTQNITKIKAAVDNYTTNKTVMEYTVTPNSKSYALYDSDLDWSLSFGKLPEGDYRLVYHVWSGSSTRSMNMLFSVKAEAPAASDTSNAEDTSDKEGAFLDLKASLAYAKEWYGTHTDKNGKVLYRSNSGGNPGSYNDDVYMNYKSKSSDCANFVSQILVAGGMPMDEQFKGDKYNLTAAFRGFDHLKVYLYNTYGVKTIMRKSHIKYCEIDDRYSKGTLNKVVKSVDTLKLSDIKPGDIIITNKDQHVMFVNKIKNGYVYAYGHTSDRNGEKHAVSLDYIEGVIKTSELYK